MSLLSKKDKESIRNAIQSLTDTFMVTPITYYLRGEMVDVWGESGSETLYYGIDLRALKEGVNTKAERAMNGSLDDKEIQLTFNLEDLERVGLVRDDSSTLFDNTQDYFKVSGNIYRVSVVTNDGPLDAKDVLVIVIGEKMERTDEVKNIKMITNGSESGR